MDRFALVVVDVQVGFESPVWGRRDNPRCDENIGRLVDAWIGAVRPLVIVQHASTDPHSPLHQGSDGFELKTYLRDVPRDLTITKSVNSSFHGEPDLHLWLTERSVPGIVVCGITTNHCCETTARVGGNLGHRVLFASDATHTFDRRHPDGTVVPAEDLVRTTETNLHGEFAAVVRTADLLDRT